MAPSSKSIDGRRKSGSKPPGRVVRLVVNSDKLRQIIDPQSIKEESPAKDTKESGKDSPDSSTPLPPPSASNGDNASDSNAATPAPDGTPAPSTMAPPADGPKRRGTKRGANGNVDGIPKPRGKPGPKKKPRLEDGTIDHSANRPTGVHKLGPKANQGAINAGLRALDRSGKPCRKWARGSFKLKSFTGVVWEINRWTAPGRKTESSTEDSAAPSADSSNKENKDSGPEGNSVSNSNSGVDVEMQSVPSAANASSPAPVPIAAAS